MPTTEETLVLALRSYVTRVRNELRDHARLNRLVLGQETSDRQIAVAIQKAVEDWSGTPPLLQVVDVTNHPRPDLLCTKAVANVLQTLVPLLHRNSLAYRDDRVQISASGQGSALLQLVQVLDAQYRTDKTAYMIAANIGGGWGSGVNSDYRGYDYASLLDSQ